MNDATDQPTRLGEALKARTEEIAARRQGGEVTLPPAPVPWSVAAALDGADVAARRSTKFDEQVWPRFAGADLAHLSPSKHERVIDWTQGPGGRNLVITGPVGSGKTFAAVAAARARALAGDDVVLTTVPALLDSMRPDGGTGCGVSLDEALRCGVLLLDDIGSERGTDWTAERLALIVDQRWLHERPIITTSNLSLGPDGSLVAAIGERSYSRLVMSEAVVTVIDGPNLRRGGAS